MGNNPDNSNGYEEVASVFIAGRGSGKGVGIGASVVTEWASTLLPGATVLDLGCGTGDPITRIFIERGFKVYGVDASPSMVAVFQARFPSVPVQCAAAEHSDFFGLSFDAVVSWGLFFLLQAEAQRKLIAKVAGALRRGGRLLFTAPYQCCSWRDAMTERISLSLGHDAYERTLKAHGMMLVSTQADGGENCYYFAQKT
jgi:SAM-dependent methyltransferase